MSKTTLADKVKVTPNTISRYESGEIALSPEIVEKFSRVLGFPVRFFEGDDIDEPRRDNASFRGRASKSGKIMDAALASGAIAFLLDDWITKSFSRPEPRANIKDSIVVIVDLLSVDPAMRGSLP